MQNRALWWKLVILGGVTLLLTAALLRIGGLVDERQQRQRAAEANVAAAQAGPQVVLGPLIQRSCSEQWESAAGPAPSRLLERRDFVLTALPAELLVDGKLQHQTRARGLFKVNAYAARLTLQARWSTLAGLAPQAEHGGRLRCEEPRVMLAVSDSRGLRSVVVQRGGEALTVVPGTANDSYPRGLHAVLPAQALDQPLSVTVAVQLLGMTDFGIVPAASATQLTLHADWPHPSFVGRFLPLASRVDAAGFEANWQVSELATTALRDVRDGKALPVIERDPDGAGPSRAATADGAKAAASIADTLAFSMIDPVNPYVMSDRAIKYGLLFIVLTFVCVGLLELLSGRRVHPVQYLLVGSAMTLFFLLLLSLSEHLSFGVSYGLAAGAAVALLGFYGSAMLGALRRGVGFGALIALLYGALYLLLSLEKAALLVGALLLFAVLAGVMALTRRIDWYRLDGVVRPAVRRATA